ncbi:MAG: hypothetical protein JNL87_10180, partial [Burkholderiaceae bacterium]|nr:hypothetical protein [Burkholderiaceae bacterium]
MSPGTVPARRGPRQPATLLAALLAALVCGAASGPARTAAPSAADAGRLADWESISRQALLQYEKGDYAAALALSRRALALAEALGEDHPAVEASLNAV